MTQSSFTKGDKSNFIIKAKFVKQTAKSYYLNCEGDLEWFPKSCTYYDFEKEQLEIPEWLYRKSF